jgi:dTMP kinase
MNKRKGLFITLEGTDGCGKSTQLRKIKSYLIDKGIYIKFLREPGGTNIGEDIRKILLDKNNKEMARETEMYLYAASRAQLIHEAIIPAINSGRYVLCDRFIYSSLVYQGMARGIGIDNVWEMNKYAIDKVMPDVAIFLDLPLEKAMRRVKNGNEDRIELEGMRFHQNAYNAYIELCNDKRFNLTRANADRGIEEIFEDIKSIIEEKARR